MFLRSSFSFALVANQCRMFYKMFQLFFYINGNWKFLLEGWEWTRRKDSRSLQSMRLSENRFPRQQPPDKHLIAAWLQEFEVGHLPPSLELFLLTTYSKTKHSFKIIFSSLIYVFSFELPFHAFIGVSISNIHIQWTSKFDFHIFRWHKDVVKSSRSSHGLSNWSSDLDLLVLFPPNSVIKCFT